MKKILFLHGFFASGQCAPAMAMKEAFRGKADVLSPDLPHHPIEALEFIHEICDKEQPDLLVGNSCGAFYAQILAPIVGIPALIGNPHLAMTDFLQQRIGRHQYKSPRADGNQHFEIDEALIDEFAKVQKSQFNFTGPYWTDKVWGLFGENDTLAHYESQFVEHYSHSFHFPGAHTPSAEEVSQYYVPLAQRMLTEIPRRKERLFRHFKGGLYRLERSAFNSETTERMVVYQALYGNCDYWVRSENMFFGKVTHNDQIFNRFTEID